MVSAHTDEDEKATSKGKLCFADVSPDGVGGVGYEVSATFDSPPVTDEACMVHEALEKLEGDVATLLDGFVLALQEIRI